MIAWIDQASYEDLLRKWRFRNRADDPLFQDKVGDYFSKVFLKRRMEIRNDEFVRISKKVGWDGYGEKF